MKPSLRFLLALLFFQGALSAFSDSAVIDCPLPVGLKARFQKGLEGLVEGKDTPSLEELNRQLSRKQTKVDAPAKKVGQISFS